MLREAGIDMGSLVDPRTRIPSSLSNRLLELDIEKLGDPAHGLRVGVKAQAGTFGMVEQLARSAPTLRESIACYERYSALIQEGSELKLIEEGPRALIAYRANGPQPRAIDDFVLAYALTMMRRHVSGGVEAEEIRLSVPPPDYRDAYLELLGIPARFDAPHDAVVFRCDDLARPMQEADAVVHAALEARAGRALERLFSSGSFLAQVRACIRGQLAQGEASTSQTARRLHVSTATLRRRLAEAGTSHREILDAMRADAGIRYVQRPNLTLNEIAERLGFGHPNGFYKAFKRWTGLSPREYRFLHEERRGVPDAPSSRAR